MDTWRVQLRAYAGLLACMQADVDGAVSLLTEGVGRYQNAPVQLNNLAVAQETTGDFERARQTIERVVQTDCAMPQLYRNLGDILQRAGRGADVDSRAVSAARRGRYPAAAFVDTVPAVRDLYFPLTDGLHDAAPGLRRMVSFHTSDLLETSRKPSRVHLIVCRNVIIYFRRETQEKLVERFHETLFPGGFLVLGKVETLLGKSREMFAPVSSRERIYRRL